MLKGIDSEQARPHNRRVVLETIRLNEPISRAEIARHTGLAAQTVSNIVGDLISSELALSRGRRRGGMGQPAMEIELNPKGAFAVGLHLDQDHVGTVLVDLKGNPISVINHREHFDTPEQAVGFLGEVVNQTIADNDIPRTRLWGVGLALPGPVYETLGEGSSVSTPDRWVRGPVRDLLAQELNLPVFVENDGTAAAIGEYWYASNKSLQSFLYVFLGLGLGGGLIFEGQPFRGFLGNAFELGHLQVEPTGAVCRCGNRGCLELYASPLSLQRAMSAAGLGSLHPEEMAGLLETNAPWFSAWFDHATDRLASAIVGFENILDPQAIVFGGRLPRPFIERFVSSLEPLVASRRMRNREYKPKLLCAEVGEYAAALGAATLPIHTALAPDHAILLKPSRAAIHAGRG